MKRHKSTKINILFPFMGNSIGGSHISSLLLVKHLPHPYNPIVLLHKRGPLVNYLEEKKIPYIINEKLLTPFDGSFQFIYRVNQLSKFLKRLKIDIIHTNEINMHTTWLLPAFFSPAKHVWHQRTPGPNKSIYLSVLSTKLITISNFNKNSFPPSLNQKMEVVFNPFHFLSDDNNFIEKKIGSTIHIGWVGNFHKRKRIDIFLKIIAKLEKTSSNLKVVAHVYGTPIEPVLSEAKKLMINEKIVSKVHFHGFVNDITSELIKMDILIASAEDEAFGRTLVEAAAVGTPIIANSDAGHKEIIINGSTGILIPSNNIEIYVDSIMKLIENNKIRVGMIKNAYRHCKSVFSIESHIYQITKIYNSLIN